MNEVTGILDTVEQRFTRDTTDDQATPSPYPASVGRLLSDKVPAT